MSTLDLIAALIAALHANDNPTIARLLEQLDERLPPEEIIDILEAALGPAPARSPAPLAACA